MKESRTSNIVCQTEDDPLSEEVSLGAGRPGEWGLGSHQGGWSDMTALTIFTGRIRTPHQMLMRTTSI